MADVPVVEIGDDEWLSQCGQRRADGSWNFRNRPRLGKEPPEQDVSWLLGRHSPYQARCQAFGRSDDYRAGKHAVRYALAGELRAVGFTVEHTPRLGTDKPVSVFWHQGDWGDREAGLLDSCCMEGVV